jgi:glycosyltransferase involved in cell wall biosynthesis
MMNQETKKLRIAVLPSDATGCFAYRSKPHIALEQMYPNEFHVDIMYEANFSDIEFWKQYDIVQFHRTMLEYENMPAHMAMLKSLGIITIMDIDDYWAPGQHHPAYLIIKDNQIDKKIIANLKLADYVTTTTQLFANEIAKINPNVFVLPNAIDPTEKQFIPAPEKSDRLRIGWLGGSSHARDLQILEGVVGKLKNDGLMDKIQFVLCGFDTRGVITIFNKDTGEKTQRKIQPTESTWYEYEKIFTDNYSTVSPRYKEHLMRFVTEEYDDIANESYRRVWTKPINSYATNYNLFDISLAPIEQNIFNKCKSELKLIEGGFYKKAMIVSDFGPYQIGTTNAYQMGGGIDTTANTFLVPESKNRKHWYKHIKTLVENPELIKIFGDNLYESVKDKYSMKKVTEDRRNLYLKLAADKLK